jgi:hypothetical protein
MWLTSQATNSPWPKSMRPDKAGGLFIGSNVPDTLAVRLDPTRFANEKLMKYINNFVLSGVTVVIIKGDKQKVYRGIERKKPLPTDPV